MPEHPTDSQKENVWITSRIRMFSERRLRLYAMISHILLTYYSFLLIVFSIFESTLEFEISFLSEISVSLAVAVFAVSLIVWGFRFEEQASNFRHCYLRLQELYSTYSDSESDTKTYFEIIEGYPNHSDRDFEDFVIDRTFFRKEEIRNSAGRLDYSKWMIFRKVVRSSLFWASILALIAAPPLTILATYNS